MKNLIATIAGYLALTSVLAGGLLVGFFWLIRTDGAESAAVRVAPISPRIADSIERKKAVVPPQAPPVASPPSRPLQQANASLSQPVAAKWFIRELSPPPAKKVRSRKRAPPPEASAAARFNAVPTTPVRSENFSGL